MSLLVKDGVLPVRRDRTSLASMIAARSWSVLRSWFTSYGLLCSPTHEIALKTMLGDFAKMATGELKGRRAYPLPPGAGKSQSMLATITALHQLQEEQKLPRRLGEDASPPYHQYTVLVAASKVEALVELIEDLTTIGKVPASKIGLLHSKRYDPAKAEAAKLGTEPDFASMPSVTDPQSVPYLFCTHQRLRPVVTKDKPKTTIPELTKYKVPFRDGKAQPVVKRDLVWWDESLLSTDAWSIPFRDLQADTLWLSPYLERQADPLSRAGQEEDPVEVKQRQDLHQYLTGSVALLSGAMKAQQDLVETRKDRATVLSMPERTQEELDGYISVLDRLPRAIPSSAVRDFIKMSWRPVRARLGTTTDSSAITFTVR